MKKPLPADNESERLAALLNYEILDTSEEALFDNISQIAAIICDAPIALVCLIDKERQWFKSHYGLKIKETPLDISFCGHVIQQNEIMIVEDACVDERFHDNPLVLGEPFVRFYAGAPLTNRQCFNLGTLCIIDHIPHKLTPLKIKLLKLLAQLVILILEDRKKNRMIIEAAPNAMVMMNKDREISLVNVQTEKLFGYNRKELMRKKIEFLIPARLQAEYLTYLAEYISAPTIHAPGVGRELFGARKDGSEVQIKIELNPLETKDGLFILASILDITESKRVDQMKNEFISTVSHELRTPLTSIKGSIGLISGEKFGKLPEKIKPLIKIALSNCERLNKLINDILDIEKIESGKMDFNIQPTDLREVIRLAVACNEGYTAQYDVMIKLENAISVMVNIDADRVAQVLANLISNAVKFSSAGKAVIISMREENEKIRVSIKDEGPGITDEFKDKIFNKFVQADSSDRRQKEGSGLGLSVCEAIVTELGGTIGFDTELGKGSTFYFEFPVLKT